MKQPALLLLLPATAVVAGAWWYAAQRPAASAPPVDENLLSLRVRFGLGDTEPAAWDGAVEVAGGAVANLRLWRPRPGESVSGTSSWSVATRRGRMFQYRAWEPEPMRREPAYLDIPGIILDIRDAGGARLRLRTKQGDFEVTPREVTAAQRFLNGRVMVDRVPAAAALTGPSHENDFVTLAAGAGNDLWVAWTAYRNEANEVLARRWDGTSWGGAVTVTEKPGDIYGVKLGRDGKGGVWAVWAAQVEGNFDLYARRFDGRAWSRTERLTDSPQPDIHPSLATDAKGSLWVAWQGFRNGQSDIFVRRGDGAQWSAPEKLSASPANDWLPALAADRQGRVYAAWDTYDQGNYDILMRRFDGTSWGAPVPVAATPKFEASVSLTCDREDRLWAAWNESGLQWGKDTGLLVRRPATQLYENRQVAVAVHANGAWQQPAADFEASLPPEFRDFNDLPVLQADGAGRVWVLFRHRYASRPKVPFTAALHGGCWELVGSYYEGERWSAPVEFPFSSGRSDMPATPALDWRGNLRVAWVTDSRDYEELIFRHADVFTAAVPSPAGGAAPLKLVPRAAGAELRTFPGHPREAEDLARIRGYSIQRDGKTYRIYRGDIHRHTEISHDGKNDGSMLDTYRYSLDAAGLDFLGMADHNSGGGPDLEYIRWLQQQLADVFHVAGSFAPLYGYERSLSFPNGHRNVMFARRGIPTLPIPPEEAKGKTGAQALYEYLKRYDGVAVSHTSATGMGTDWRDNDPQVEPLVEIYQGDRVSAEHEGAPKAASRGDATSHAGGFRPEGYVWNAWAKGYKLGVQASSDHLSTHISYACTLATEFTRQGLLEGMKRRHSYGATDNIVLDFRIRGGGQELLQGDIGKIPGDFQLAVRILGTAPIRQIDIIRSNQYIHNRQNLPSDVDFTFADNQPLAGESYYYVRVLQVNEQMAWSSPIWITR